MSLPDLVRTKEIAEEIFLAGVQKVMPDNLVREYIQLRDGIIYTKQATVNLSGINNIYVFGFGKASSKMAAEFEKIMDRPVRAGCVITKYGHSVQTEKIKVIEAGHPVPDKNGIHGTAQLVDMIHKIKQNDLVVFFISGGGSSLLVDLPPGSQLPELQELNNLLIKSGASIDEINTVRKHLSKLKGGQLALKTAPVITLAFIISDVIHDHEDVIASGPTIADPTTYQDALDVLQKYDLQSSIPRSLLYYLEEGVSRKIDETPKTHNASLSHVINQVIGNNQIALEAAKSRAISLGYQTIIMDAAVEGPVEAVGDQILHDIITFHENTNKSKPLCLLYGGEPSVKVHGDGKGGRNQHLVLYLLQKLQGRNGITFLSAGTDGTDGPTDVAGAVITIDPDAPSIHHSQIKQSLKTFNSFHFFQKYGGHVITGPTGTNVMDMMVTIIH
jgi:glycerate 2-kinase